MEGFVLVLSKPKKAKKIQSREQNGILNLTTTMLSISQVPSFSLTSAKSLRSPSSSSSSLSLFFSFFPRVSRLVRASSGISNLPLCSSTPVRIPRVNNAGLKLEETVDAVKGKIRLDSWISSRVHGVSRARVQSSIRLGLVSVNGQVVDKV